MFRNDYHSAQFHRAVSAQKEAKHNKMLNRKKVTSQTNMSQVQSVTGPLLISA